MNVLVDTSIWSIALRWHKKKHSENDKSLVAELIELINESRANIIGPIRQELLSGIANETQFTQLKKDLDSFIDISITAADYENAAKLFNTARKKGVQGSHIDFLICAIAIQHGMPIFTADKDFLHYSKYINIQLYIPRTTK